MNFELRSGFGGARESVPYHVTLYAAGRILNTVHAVRTYSACSAVQSQDLGVCVQQQTVIGPRTGRKLSWNVLKKDGVHTQRVYCPLAAVSTSLHFTLSRERERAGGNH